MRQYAHWLGAADPTFTQPRCRSPAKQPRGRRDRCRREAATLGSARYDQPQTRFGAGTPTSASNTSDLNCADTLARQSDRHRARGLARSRRATKPGSRPAFVLARSSGPRGRVRFQERDGGRAGIHVVAALVDERRPSGGEAVAAFRRRHERSEFARRAVARSTRIRAYVQPAEIRALLRPTSTGRSDSRSTPAGSRIGWKSPKCRAG
jgi:hypothetical protein